MTRVGKPYTCAHCHQTLLEGQSEEDAQRAALDNWGVRPDQTEMVMEKVCDDCYKKIMEWLGRPV